MTESVYISYSEGGSELASKISSWFNKVGFETFRSDPILKNSPNYVDNLRERLSEVQIVVIVLSSDFSRDEGRFYQDIKHELYMLEDFRESARKRNGPLIIPIVDETLGNKLPAILMEYNSIHFKNIKTEEEQILNKIQRVVSAYTGERAAIEREETEIKDRIETSSAEYINETIKELTSRESKLSKTANLWYIAGYSSFILGIISTVLLTIVTYKDHSGEIEWSEIIFWTVRGLVIIILFIAASKYSFELAKTFMNESLKNSDRIHAISFGKFYLQVFGKNVKSDEIMNVFQYWNIDKNSSFNGLDSNKFDPNVLEMALKLITVAREGKIADKDKKATKT
ncbi:hypothetical protein BFP97_07320 [Roseivirga sp. 4D4]|uniref:TIR domain-containing protein n=1 Tax=Roseivirga sp. 4D4 TaxID=1889784 RepID=UPI000852D486|nr:TIR domain-containing protein [Roseivirga sp. 4D4]OEK01334.1 hypothetical protein BFP97_07320 [Roseivirga sp. 4D4]